MSTRYKIRSPIDIWTAYGGDQQRIAQAMQLGVIRPEEGVLAVMEGKRKPPPPAAQGTVAQQVMGIVPPPTNPMAPGMGAPAPQPAPPMQAPMGAPMGAPPAPMPGMAMGGIASLPIPGAMFDEPDNGGYGDGYAGGGLVAFADGGDIDLERFRQAIIAQESSGDYGAVNKESGAMGAYQFMEPTARAIAKRLGMAYRPDLLTGRSKEAKEYQDRLGTEQLREAIDFGGGDVGRAGIYHFAGPNEAGWGPKTREYKQDIMQRYSGSKDSGEVPERDTFAASGRMGSLEDIIAAVQNVNRKSPEEVEGEKRVRARLEERATEEYYEQQRKADMWQTLAEVGFNMASSKSPYVLQAIGEAAAAAMPGARADKKERKAAQDRAIDGLMELGARNRKEAMEGLRIAVPIWQAGMSAEEAERSLEFREKELKSRETQAELDRQVTIAAALARQNNPSTFETQLAAYRKAYPNFSDVALFKEMRKDGLLGGGQGGMALPGAEETGGAGGDTSGMSIVGSRPVQ
jgi:hypothetical protein